jgi:3',5'-cyclic AMP phosphodiesterase CpdA
MPARRAILAGFLALASGWPRAEAGAPPDLCFAHISDTHCIATARNPKPRHLLDPMAKNLVASFDLLETAVADINQHVRPDFVVATGDLAERREDLSALRRVKRILAKLDCPWFPVVGNHDGELAWAKVFGTRRFNYTFELGGWRGIVLDSSSGRIGPGPLATLRRLLDADRETPTLLFTHVPMTLPESHLEAAKRLYRVDWLLLANRRSVHDVVAGRSNVHGIFAGHCHVPSTAPWAGAVHQTAPALAALGHHYAVVAVKGGTLTTTYRTVQLNTAATAGDAPR